MGSGRTALFALLTAACGAGPGAPDGAPDGAAPDDAGPGLDAAAPDADLPTGTIDELLAGIDGLAVQEVSTSEPGYRLFRLAYDQPVDHADPGGPRFTQHMVLMHRSLALPMVLGTEGYWLYPDDSLEELTEVLGANQLRVEHRFFDRSVPDVLDWSRLTIAQAAADHHRIATALRPVYRRPWVATGVSKGGMTAVYFRRFYPGDVDATVAYVAPLSRGAPDDRYLAFFDQVGTASCRADLRAAQREALLRRASLLPLAEAEARDEGHTFARVGGLEVAWEIAVTELEWQFWQSRGATACADIPGAAADDAALFAFVDDVSGAGSSSDQSIAGLAPYYYQAEVELGYPSMPTGHLTDLLVYDEVDAATYLPPGVEARFDGAAMTDVADWVAGDGERLMFIYGGDDPWTAGAFELGAARDSYLFVAPGHGHGADLAALPTAERDHALAALSSWTGVTARLAPERRGEDDRAAPTRRPPRIGLRP